MGISTRCKLPSSRASHASPTNYLTSVLLVILFVLFLLVIVIILVVFCIKMKCTSLSIKKEEDDRNLEQGRNQQATLQASINCLLPLQ
jgi:flagellar basal body-associated protein FliL